MLNYFKDSKLYPKLLETQKILQQAIDIYGHSNLSLSFNGGKDCTVLLYIYTQLLKEIGAKEPIKSLYIKSVDPFPQVDEFINECTKEYPIEIEEYQTSLKEGLRQFMASNTNIKAIIIGTRRTDPFSQNLQDFQETDGDWPRITRIHPILDWDYDDIWKFLLELRIPYCSLYDLGYTSLGGQSNTLPNPELKHENGFRPAYELKDGSKERLGRNK